ncbi:serine protease inhibitor ecotin [Ralstonia sp. UBA689]|uniref:serine protease inhibitor ecotin n=1 Tax=Ralstonia sp. UBA689 TaxID=1947373 RepID=UPI0025D11C14|nr:serine protease inhibitor ecotin [Ralstonia sp. UBA689]
MKPIPTSLLSAVCAALFCVAGSTIAATQALAATPGGAVSADDIKMFPKAQDGQKRVVISLPAATQEDDIQVELIVGKTMRVDCNRHWFMGSLTQETVQGWGYSYYQLADAKGPAATMMACPGQPEHEAFVPVRGEGYLLRYNSRLPLVVYVPQAFEVRYRLWHASTEMQSGREQ